MLTPLFKDTRCKVKNVVIEKMDFSMAERLMSQFPNIKGENCHFVYIKEGKRAL